MFSVLSKCWFRTLFGGNISAPKLGCVKQALHGFLEFELFKTRSNNYWNLWKTNKFALLHQHVCNKCLQHLATSSRAYTIIFWITLTCISSDATNVRFTLDDNSLVNAEVWRCIFICRVRLTISTSSLSNSLMRKSKIHHPMFCPASVFGRIYSAFGVL